MYHIGHDKGWRAESFLHNSQWGDGSTFTEMNSSSPRQVNIKIMNDWNRGGNPLGSIFSRSIVKPSETNEDQVFLAELQKSERSPVLHLKRCALKVRPLGALKSLGMVGVSERRMLDASLNEAPECEESIRQSDKNLPRRAIAQAQASELQFWTHKKRSGHTSSRVRHKSDRLAEGYLKSLLPKSNVNVPEAEKLYRKMEDLSLQADSHRRGVLHNLNFKVTQEPVNVNVSQLKRSRTNEVRTKPDRDDFPLPLSEKDRETLLENKSYFTHLRKKINCSDEQGLASSRSVFFKSTMDDASERNFKSLVSDSPALHRPQNPALLMEQPPRPHFLPAIQHKWSSLTVPRFLPENTPPPSPLQNNSFDMPENLTITVPLIKSRKQNSN